MSHAETETRRRLDQAVGRALFDRAYAAQLLADPVIALGDGGCSPQQYLQLRAVRAVDLRDLARQVEALFWPLRSAQALPVERRELLAASGF